MYISSSNVAVAQIFSVRYWFTFCTKKIAFLLHTSIFLPYRKCRKKLEQKSQRRHLCPAQAGWQDELFTITNWNFTFDNLTSFCPQQILCFDCLVQIDASKTFLTSCQNLIKFMIKFIMLWLFCFCNSSDSEMDGSIESEESELSVEDLEEVL